MHHGVKFETSPNPEQTMEKQRTQREVVLPILVGANPYLCQYFTAPTDIYQDSTRQQSAAKRRLEMEEFRDLSPLLSSYTVKNASQISDELNTPIFDRKGPFDFSQQTYCSNNNTQENSTVNHLNFKIKTEQPSDCYYVNGLTKDSEDIFTTINLNSYDPYGLTTLQLKPETKEDARFSPSTSEENLTILKQSPMYDDNKLNEELEYLESVGTLRDILCVSDSNTTQPSMHSAESDETAGSFKRNFRSLRLNVDGKLMDTSSALSTPEVIKTITDIENENFNILDIVSDREIGTVSLEDLHLTLPITPLNSPLVVTSARRARKRKFAYEDDDDDEDYVPPVKGERKSASHKSWECSDCSSDEEDSRKHVRRGRPSKRNSVSSESSRGSGASKYRELRDKNNEASRKSRLKRKKKEMGLEREAEVLHDANIKLKAKVEHLEKTVSNFRSNLFKIMLSK